MIFSTRRVDISGLYINDSEIEIVNTFEFLGFYLEARLTHKAHFCYVRSKLTSFKYITFLLKHYLRFDAEKTFDFGMTRLLYVLVLWFVVDH